MQFCALVGSALETSGSYHQRGGIVEELMEFVQKICARRTIVQILQEIQKMLAQEGVQPSQLKNRIISVSMHKDIVWFQNRNKVVRKKNATRAAEDKWNSAENKNARTRCE